VARKTAVIIDDEPDLTSFLSSILENNGFDVRCANDGTSGEKLIREDPPSVILLDLMMPGLTGVQLFAKLRGDEATKHIPLVMVTGIKETLNIDWATIVDNLRARKPDGFVEKPIDPDRLMKVVNGVVAGRGTTDKILHG
jgi:DNA-binding response OmpR family regulator